MYNKHLNKNKGFDIDKVISIVQARMGSTRLPGKVMIEIAGEPVLSHIVTRLKYASSLDGIAIATTSCEEDKIIVRLANRLQVEYFAGSQNDVLDRYYQTAKRLQANVIVRVTGDCPLIDPRIVDHMVDYFRGGQFDYVSNCIVPTYPDGLDVEVFSFDVLEKAWKEAHLPSEREHVTSYIWNNAKKFRLGNYANQLNLAHLRWTLDEPKDLEFIREIFKRLYIKDEVFYMEDVLEVLQKNPELTTINQGIIRNSGYIKSILEDKLKK